MKELDNFNEIPRKAWYKKWWVIVLAILFVLFMIMSAVVAYYMYDIIKNGFEDDANTAVSSENLKEIVMGNDDNYWIGSSKPLITIVEFADFSCPYCKESFPKIREISKKYKNQVKIIFRDYPVLSDNSFELAMAGRCAGEQGLFWVMHDKLFLNQGVSTAEELLDLARQIGADEARFKKCFEGRKYNDAIKKDYDDGVKLEISGTPTWYVNGTRVEGNIPYDIFINMIEQFIKENTVK
jgi:protein-disulfide isomerase